jgi:hypothetical protein
MHVYVVHKTLVMKRGLVGVNICCRMYLIGFQQEVTGGTWDSLNGVVGRLWTRISMLES